MAHALFFQCSRIGIGNDSTAKNENVSKIASTEFFHDAGKQREVGTRQQRQPHSIDIFLQSRLCNLLWGLVQTRIDDFESMVSKGTRNGFCTTVVTIEARFSYDNSVRPLHKKETLRRCGIFLLTRHTVGVASSRLKSPLARAFGPVGAGIVFFALLFLALWGAASLISRNPESITNLGAQTFRVGLVTQVAKTVTESGPVLYPDLRDPDGKRSIVLDHQGADPAKGWRVFYAYPADRDEACLATQVKETRTFTDCSGRNVQLEDLAKPTDVRPLVENRTTLYIDLRATK